MTVSLPPTMLPKKGGFDLIMAVRVTNAQNVTSFGVAHEMVLHILKSSDSATAGESSQNRESVRAPLL